MHKWINIVRVLILLRLEKGLVIRNSIVRILRGIGILTLIFTLKVLRTLMEVGLMESIRRRQRVLA